jgi:hypothetical protein
MFGVGNKTGQQLLCDLQVLMSVGLVDRHLNCFVVFQLVYVIQWKLCSTVMRNDTKKLMSKQFCVCNINPQYHMIEGLRE